MKKPSGFLGWILGAVIGGLIIGIAAFGLGLSARDQKVDDLNRRLSEFEEQFQEPQDQLSAPLAVQAEKALGRAEAAMLRFEVELRRRGRAHDHGNLGDVLLPSAAEALDAMQALGPEVGPILTARVYGLMARLRYYLRWADPDREDEESQRAFRVLQDRVALLDLPEPDLGYIDPGAIPPQLLQ